MRRSSVLARPISISRLCPSSFGARNQRDYTMLQGLMVIYCFLIVVVNAITDLLYGVLDPRVKAA